MRVPDNWRIVFHCRSGEKVLAERYPRHGYLTLQEMLKHEGRVNPPT